MMFKRALPGLMILILCISLVAPFAPVKADTSTIDADFTTAIQDVETLVDSDKELFYDSLGLASTLSMRSTGYTAPASSNVIQQIGRWTWDKIKNIGNALSTFPGWVKSKATGIINALKPSNGSHGFSYKNDDTPFYNALYTDDEWNSLVGVWSAANTPNSNFITFDDVTDDVEGWADRYYANYISYAYPNGYNNVPVEADGMSVSLRSDLLKPKPSVVTISTLYYSDVPQKRYITKLPLVGVDPYIDYIIYKPTSDGGTTMDVYFKLSDGTFAKSYQYVVSGTNYIGYEYQMKYHNATLDENAKYVYEWALTSSQSYSVQLPYKNMYGTFDPSTAADNIYQWYHYNNGNTVTRYFNIPCYYSFNYDGSGMQPLNIHPDASSWTAPTQTPVYINNTRVYYGDTNINLTSNDYTRTYNIVINNTYDAADVIYHITNITPVTFVLNNPIYIYGTTPTPDPGDPTPTPDPEEPEPTPEPITPTPEPTATPTPSPTPGPVEITGTVEITNIPTPPYDVYVLNPSSSPIPVIIIDDSDDDIDDVKNKAKDSDDEWGFDLEIPDDYPEIDIELPSYGNLTSASNISGTTLDRTLEQGYYGEDGVTYTDVTQILWQALPHNTMIILFIFFFITLIICFLTK